jgi:L-ribulose-5-phosphate 4-epimerase
MATTESSLREEVAAVTLLLNDLGILGYSGHVSARLPGDRFLIQSYDQSRASLRPGDLLVCDLDGKVVAGPKGLKPPSEVFLHCEILRSRADVESVAHFHHDLTTAFTLVEGVELRVLKNHAVRWANGIPTHPDPSHVSSPALGRAVAKALGDRHGLLIRAHGQVVVAENARALLIDCVHFVENAEAMYRAAALGRVLPLSASEVAAFLHDFDRDRHVAKLWKYYGGIGRAKHLLPAEWEL